MEGIRQARFTIEQVVLQNIFPPHIDTNNPHLVNSFRSMREGQAKVLKDWIGIFYHRFSGQNYPSLRKSYIQSRLYSEDIYFYNKVIELENKRY